MAEGIKNGLMRCLKIQYIVLKKLEKNLRIDRIFRLIDQVIVFRGFGFNNCLLMNKSQWYV